MPSQRTIGAAYIALSATAFGAMPIFIKFAYQGGADMFAVLTLRFALAAAVMLMITLAGRRPWPRGRHLWLLIGVGGVGYVSQAFGYFAALNYASVGLVALLLYLYPCLVTLLAAVFWRQRLGKLRLLLLASALSGIALTLNGALDGSLLGIGLALGAALIYAIYILVLSRVTAAEDTYASTTVVMLVAAVLFALIASFNEPQWPVSFSAWSSVLAIALVSTVFAMLSFFTGMRYLGPADAATLSTLEPVVTLLLASWLLGEHLQALQLLGGAIILLSAIALARLQENSSQNSLQ